MRLREPVRPSGSSKDLIHGTPRFVLTVPLPDPENNRKARFYSLTARGRAQLLKKAGEWRRLARAIGMILGPEEQEG